MRAKIKAAMIREARELEARAIELEHPSAGCLDPIRAAALYRIAALVYENGGNEAASAANWGAAKAARLKAEQAVTAESERLDREPQKELF